MTPNYAAMKSPKEPKKGQKVKPDGKKEAAREAFWQRIQKAKAGKYTPGGK